MTEGSSLQSFLNASLPTCEGNISFRCDSEKNWIKLHVIVSRGLSMGSYQINFERYESINVQSKPT